MSTPTPVINTHADHEEFIERVAKIVGSSQSRQAVFSVVYGRRSKPLTFEYIKSQVSDSFPEQTIRNHLNHLSKHNVISRKREIGRSFYGKIDHVAANKAEILRFANDKNARARIPTKRRPEIKIQIAAKQANVPLELVNARHLAIDEIDSFKKVRKTISLVQLEDELSEEEFKKGVQEILGEPGEFKDWGGETSDLMTTRLLVNGKRRRAAFAFKGPGLKTKLTIAKMGKNGDQCPRLFQEPADVFVVQHCREIVSSVIKLVETHTQLKSVYENREILFCIIDGKDSKRLVDAYSDAFEI